MEKTTLSKEDFDLTIRHELFTKMYSIGKEPFDNEIHEWEVSGFFIYTSSGRRNIKYELISSPISVYVAQNVRTDLVSLEHSNFVGADKKEILGLKKELIDSYVKNLYDSYGKAQ